MKLLRNSVIFFMVLTQYQCTFNVKRVKTYSHITIKVNPSNNIQLKWNGTIFNNGSRVEISNPNSLQIIRSGSLIAELSIDKGANDINEINITIGNQGSCTVKRLHGNVYNSTNNNSPITGRRVYKNIFTSSRTDSYGYYSLCFGDKTYDYGYTKLGLNNDIKVTVKNQEDEDLKIDVYLDDSEPFIPEQE
ncbi:MAG: hypothetical protein KA479_05950 [Saprospiraceae bacterium]|nr:hypothetical protein [Saprospiraceae bacterium]